MDFTQRRLSVPAGGHLSAARRRNRRNSALLSVQQYQQDSTSNISRSDAYGLTHRWHRPIFLAHISEPISMGVNAHSYPVSPVFVRR